MQTRLATIAALAAALMVSAASMAQGTPEPITLVVPAPPGGANDSLARLLAARFQEVDNRPAVVLNRPGGNLMVGTNYVINSKPDGQTLLVVGNSAVTVNPVLMENYDAHRNLVPVARLATLQMLLAVHPSVPANSVEELIALAHAQPGKLNYASGTPVFHIAMEMFKHLSRSDIAHIPYNGTAQATTAMLAGDVDMTIGEATSSGPQVKAGRMKALAAIPEVNGMPELKPLSAVLPDYDLTVWLGLFAPRGTPADTVRQLHADVQRLMNTPDTREKMLAMGMLPDTDDSSPEELAQAIADATDKVRALAQSAGLAPR